MKKKQTNKQIQKRNKTKKQTTLEKNMYYIASQTAVLYKIIVR